MLFFSQHHFSYILLQNNCFPPKAGAKVKTILSSAKLFVKINRNKMKVPSYQFDRQGFGKKKKSGKLSVFTS